MARNNNYVKAEVDVYQDVTNRIIAEIEKGEIPWVKPWSEVKGPARSYSTGKAYCLINQIILEWSGEYVTFPEAQKLGGHVKKGEKGTKIISWAKIRKVEEFVNEDGETEKRERVILLPKYYTVFEVSQCEGLERKTTEEPTTYGTTPIEAAENIMNGYISREPLKFIQSGGNRAFYSPATDTVTVPAISRFENVAEFYSTSFHELTHSTGHVSRLNRFSGSDAAAAFGDESYSKEELVAEIGAATLCNISGVENANSFRNSAAYVQGWLKALKDDKKLIVQASARADKAVNYILGIE